MLDDLTFTSLTGKSTKTATNILMVAGGTALAAIAAGNAVKEFGERKTNPKYIHKKVKAARREQRRQERRG